MLLLLWTGGLCLECRPAAPPVQREEDLRATRSQVLVDALSSSSEEVRAQAARAMGRIQSSDYTPALAEAVRGDEAGAVRLAALFALGQLGLLEGSSGLSAAAEAAAGALDDGDPEIVAAAVEALGKLAGPHTAQTVLPYLGHVEPQVRVEAALALFRHRYVPVWRRDRESPPPLPPAAVAALARALVDESPPVREAAAYAFSRYGQPEAAEALAAVLDDESEWTRLFALRALGRSRALDLMEPMAKTLTDPSPRVRTEAIEALRGLGTFADPDAPDAPDALDASTTLAKALPELADDESFHVRAAVCRALAESQGSQSLELLRRLEKDESPTVRAQALESLARRLGDGYLTSLRAHLETGPWPLRVAAARGLAQLGEKSGAVGSQALAHEDPRVRAAALESLGSRSSSPAARGAVDRALPDALASPDLGVRGTAVTVLAGLEHEDKLAWLREAYESSPGEEWIEIRESVVDAVAPLAEAEGLLGEIAHGDDAPSVRRRARLALGKRGVPTPAPRPGDPDPSPFLGQTFPDDPTVVLATSKGDIHIRCLAREAPIHVANFLHLVAEGFYDGLVWHRVVSNFVIQGGDPRGDGWGGPGYTLRDEINPVRYRRGSVGMPKAGKDTGGCQVFITHLPTPRLDGNYTLFGQVVSGLEVVDEIEVGDKILRAYRVQ